MLPHPITEFRITWSRGKSNNRWCVSSFPSGLLSPVALIVTGTAMISELRTNKKLQERITGKHPRPEPCDSRDVDDSGAKFKINLLNTGGAALYCLFFVWEGLDCQIVRLKK